MLRWIFTAAATLLLLGCQPSAPSGPANQSDPGPLTTVTVVDPRPPEPPANAAPAPTSPEAAEAEEPGSGEKEEPEPEGTGETETTVVGPPEPSGEPRRKTRPWSREALRVATTSLRVGGRSFGVRVVRVRLDSARVELGLAQGRVGAVASLGEIASRAGAVAAINGSFFEAYTSDPIKVPHHTLFTNGEVVHKGAIGTVVGFTEDSRVLMGRLPLRIEGALDGRYRHPDNWWAYWLNRLPSTPDSVILFTPAWGGTTGLSDGVQVTVSGGRVTGMGAGPRAIPAGGYVIYLRGREEELAERFRIGRRCDYRIVRAGSPDLGEWGDVREAVGAGPRLVTAGRITVDPVGEGFSHAKILSMRAGRSMVGVTRDGWLILAISSGTVHEMAGVMKALGAEEAMNLDGGASSGLWAEGRALVTPGRLISNALLVLKR